MMINMSMIILKKIFINNSFKKIYNHKLINVIYYSMKKYFRNTLKPLIMILTKIYVKMIINWTNSKKKLIKD